MTMLLDLSLAELKQQIEEMGEKGFRAGQIYAWLTACVPFEQMSNLSKPLREKLRERFSEGYPEIAQKLCSKDGTRKYLLRLADESVVECVLMNYEYGRTLCISTQVGCAMGCAFCASTKGGLRRNLSAGEILGQLLAACVGTAAFSALFGVPKKYWLDCGICGAVGWGVYLAVMAVYQTPIIGTFAASAVLTMLSRCLAIQRKAPTILFLVCGIFPLVPGAAIYYTAYNFFMRQEALALQYGMDTIKMAIAIGLGIGAAYSLPGHLFGWKREIEVWEPGKEGKK